jgi:WD40 repeat protein
LKLPLELITKILKFVNIKDATRYSLLCKLSNNILNRDEVCRNLFSCHFPHINSAKIKDFPKAYRKFCSNLTKAVYTSQTIKNEMIECLIISNDAKRAWVVSQSYDTIEIWDLEKLICTKSIKGGTSRTRSFAIFDDKMFISGSMDGKIEISDLSAEVLTCTATIEGHEDVITSLAIFDNGKKLISASGYEEGMIKIWDLETLTCTATIEGNSNGPISSLAISDDGRLILGFFNGMIEIWNLETLTCTATV